LDTIKTLRSLVDTFHSRTAYGALIELARLSRERERLSYEEKRWEKRSEQIKAGLEEIRQAERWLNVVVARERARLGGFEGQVWAFHLRERSGDQARPVRPDTILKY